VEPGTPADQRPDAATLTAQAASPTPTDPAPTETPTQSRAQNLHDYPVLTRLADRLGQDHAGQEFQSALTSLLDRISRLRANPAQQ
jgi:hypothetical protein